MGSFELRHLGLSVLNSCLLTAKAAPPDNTWFQFGPFSFVFALGLRGRRVSHYCICSLTSPDLTNSWRGKWRGEHTGGQWSRSTWAFQNLWLADTPKFLDHIYPRNTLDIDKTLYGYSLVLNVQFTASKLNSDQWRILYSSSVCGLLGIWMILHNPFSILIIFWSKIYFLQEKKTSLLHLNCSDPSLRSVYSIQVLCLALGAMLMHLLKSQRPWSSLAISVVVKILQTGPTETIQTWDWTGRFTAS